MAIEGEAKVNGHRETIPTTTTTTTTTDNGSHALPEGLNPLEPLISGQQVPPAVRVEGGVEGCSTDDDNDDDVSHKGPTPSKQTNVDPEVERWRLKAEQAEELLQIERGLVAQYQQKERLLVKQREEWCDLMGTSGGKATRSEEESKRVAELQGMVDR